MLYPWSTLTDGGLLLHREQDFDEDIEDENVPFDIVAAADASGNAKRQLIISR